MLNLRVPSGAVTVTGVIATVLTLALRPEATYFFSFTAASVIFDVLVFLSTRSFPRKY